MSYCQSLLLLLLFLAALADLKTDHIPNGFLVAGMVTGLAVSRFLGPGLSHSAVSMLLAFLLMYPLFKIGTMGAGDIKTLIMAGSFMTAKDFLTILAAAFVIGAVLSLVKLLTEHNGRERMAYLLSYVSDVAASRRWKLYGENADIQETGHRSAAIADSSCDVCTKMGRRRDYDSYCRNKIHFTIPVLFGAALRIGGLI